MDEETQFSPPNGASNCCPEIVLANPDEFLLCNKNKPNNFIWGQLFNGELAFIVENTPKDGTGCPGKWMFAEMMKHFGASVVSVRGSWTYGDNLATVNTLTTGVGKDLEDAAKQTWTGKRCAEWGYSQVEIISISGSPGKFSSVQVSFKKT